MASEYQPGRDAKRIASRYLSSGLHADLTLRFSGNERKVHKVVVCSQSDWFQKACEGPFKEGSSSVIDLEEDDPLAVSGMIAWMYDGDYISEDWNGGALDLALFYLTVYETANKYGVDGLRYKVAERFKDLVMDYEPLNTCEGIKEIIRALYDSVSHDGHGLREYIFRGVCHSLPTPSPEMDDFVKENPAFAVDFFKFFWAERRRQEDDWCYRKETCKKCDYNLTTTITPAKGFSYDDITATVSEFKATTCPQCKKFLELESPDSYTP